MFRFFVLLPNSRGKSIQNRFTSKLIIITTAAYVNSFEQLGRSFACSSWYLPLKIILKQFFASDTGNRSHYLGDIWECIKCFQSKLTPKEFTTGQPRISVDGRHNRRKKSCVFKLLRRGVEGALVYIGEYLPRFPLGMKIISKYNFRAEQRVSCNRTIPYMHAYSLYTLHGPRLRLGP